MEGDIHCWLCEKAIGNAPESFNVIFVSNEAAAICQRCAPKANVLIKREFTIPDPEAP